MTLCLIWQKVFLLGMRFRGAWHRFWLQQSVGVLQNEEVLDLPPTQIKVYSRLGCMKLKMVHAILVLTVTTAWGVDANFTFPQQLPGLEGLGCHAAFGCNAGAWKCYERCQCRGPCVGCHATTCGSHGVHGGKCRGDLDFSTSAIAAACTTTTISTTSRLGCRGSSTEVPMW